MSFLLKNKGPLLLLAAFLALAYFVYTQVQNIATLEEKLKQRQQELEQAAEEYRKEIERTVALYNENIVALNELSSQVKEEAAALREKELEIRTILEDIESAPESKDWANTPLPSNVISGVHAIHIKLRNSTESSPASPET